MLPFKAKLSIWGVGMISCGFWHLLLVFLVQLSVWLKILYFGDTDEKIKREDVPPNERYYAERYYLKD